MIRSAAIALAVVICGLAAASAVAGTKFATQLSIKDDRSSNGDVMSGKVGSKAHACVSKRKVRLLHRQVSQNATWSVIAKLRTNSKGKWTFKPKKNSAGVRFVTPGNYHVRVGEVTLNDGDGAITCKEKYSSSLFMG